MNQLPVLASEDIQPTTAPNEAARTHRIRILLADDDLSTRELNAGVLAHSGYQVNTAGDGVEAWQALSEEPYDLLITDQQMPWVTGLELIQKLRSEAKMLPVILISGMLPAEELSRPAGLKIDAMLQKPCPLEVLLHTVREVLRKTGATAGFEWKARG